MVLQMQRVNAIGPQLASFAIITYIYDHTHKCVTPNVVVVDSLVIVVVAVSLDIVVDSLVIVVVVFSPIKK